ncbi:CFEM domain-containing protein [Aspergillus foveolatus]|uniref:CFEM domain-containing protein n=1 Tax=Aspergillus foveolatus TaxID=210207 RepID=UPI003CCDBD69
MRFLVPLALLGATATTVVAETPQDLLQDTIPPCMQSCFTDVLEKMTGCDLSDTDCVCKAGTPDSDAISTFKDGLTLCVKNSNCTASETQQLTDLNVNSLMSKTSDVCSGAVTVSANVALAAGAMAFAFFL